MSSPLPPSIREIVEAIHRDHDSGAVSLARQAAGAFRKLANGAETTDANLRVQAETLGQLLIRAQPSMAPLSVLSGRCQNACAATSPSTARAALTQAVDDFLTQLSVSADRIATSAQEFIPDRATVLTISASATVLHALQTARQAGRTFPSRVHRIAPTKRRGRLRPRCGSKRDSGLADPGRCPGRRRAQRDHHGRSRRLHGRPAS